MKRKYVLIDNKKYFNLLLPWKFYRSPELPFEGDIISISNIDKVKIAEIIYSCGYWYGYRYLGGQFLSYQNAIKFTENQLKDLGFVFLKDSKYTSLL